MLVELINKLSKKNIAGTGDKISVIDNLIWRKGSPFFSQNTGLSFKTISTL